MKELVPDNKYKKLSQGGLESLVTAMVHGLAACDIIRRCSRECTGKPAIWFLSGWLDVMWLGDGFMSHRSRAQHLLGSVDRALAFSLLSENLRSEMQV